MPDSQPKTRWTPHVTVATVVEKDGRYLLVHEEPEGIAVYNQPAGHLDEGESLIAAAMRETLEETGWEVDIRGYLGVYRFVAPNGITYMRHGFAASPRKYHKEAELDQGIIKALWLSYEEIQQRQHQMRSPMVINLIEDYRARHLYPLSLLHET